MDIKIREIELSLLKLKRDYKKALDETMPEIFQRLEALEDLEKRIKSLELGLEKIRSGVAYEVEEELELPDEFNFEQRKKEILQDQESEEKERLNRIKEPVFESVEEIKIKKEVPVVFIFILNRLKSVLGPFESLFESFIKFYRHYKDQGKGPAFLMTITGIIALILGFGYLIQYSFSNFFNEWAKTVTVFLCGFGIIYGAGRLYNNKDDMKDYASGLIGLGIIINYLGIYGAGPYYHLINSLFAFILLISNTLFAFFLSIRFTTRIVSFIAMAGGIFFPLALGSSGESANIYLSYLFILCLMTIFVAYKIHWKVLSYLTIVLSLFMVEATAARGLFQLFMVHLFFYLYFYFLLFEGKKIKEILVKKEIVILSALFVFFTELIISLAYSKEGAGFVLCINAIVFAGLFFKFIKENIKSFFLIFSGLFACIAILNLVSPEFAGTIWGLEALILIYAGFKFSETLVRREGYLLFTASIAGILYTIIKGLIVFNSVGLLVSFINLFFAGAYLFCLRFIMEKNEEFIDGIELKIIKLVDNLVFVWISATYIFTLYHFFPDYLLVLGVFPLPYYLYRAGTRGLIFGEFFAFIHLVFPGLQILITGFKVSSFVFVDLDLLGKIAQLEIFFSFILIYHIYERFNKDGYLYKAAFYLRYLFFMIIPVGFLPSIYKYYYSYLPIVLWGSVCIALFLYFYLKKLFMLYELEILCIAAFVFSAFYSFFYLTGFMGTYSIFQLPGLRNQVLLNSIVFGIPIGLMILFGIFIFTGGFKKESYEKEAFKRVYLGAFIYLSYAVFLYSSLIMENLYAGLCAVTLYSLYIAFKRPVKPWFIDTYKSFFGASLVLTGIMAFTLLVKKDDISWIYLFITAAVTGVLIHMERFFLYDKEPVFKSKKLIYSYFNLIVVMFFVIILNAFDIDIKGPYLTIFLVIQGTILLFGTLKPVYKDCMKIPVTIFVCAFLKLVVFDLSGLSIIGKIIAFMGIGVVLIAGAYQFQKLRIKYGE